MGTLLISTARRQDAFAVTKEAVDIFRRFVQGQAEESTLGKFAQALLNVAWLNVELGLRDEARRAYEEAVGIYRKLSETNPAYLDKLASSLMLSAMYGDGEVAIDGAREAVKIFQGMPQQQEMRAVATTALALCAQHQGLQEEAGLAARGVVSLCREIAETRQSLSPALASMLRITGDLQSEIGHQREALATVQGAYDEYRFLAQKEPQKFLAEFAEVSTKLAELRTELSCGSEALTAVRDAVTSYRRLVEENPESFLAPLVSAIDLQARVESELGNATAAVAASQAAVDVSRSFVQRDRHRFAPVLARALAIC